MEEKTQHTYQRLPGKKKNLAGCYRLYQGSDHLLLVYSRFGMEDYRRFYFSDIQSISTYKTTTGLVQNILIVSIGALFGLALLPSGGAGTTIGIIMVAIFAGLLAFNLYCGPTCETTIQTAVQTGKLHSLNRLRNAHKVIDRIAPLIRTFQGVMQPSQFGSKPMRAEPTRPAKPAPSAPKKVSRTPNRDKGYAHLALFGLLVTDMVLVLVNTGLHLAAITLVSTIVSLAIAVSVIVALVRQTNGRMPGSVRWLTWSALGYVCVSWVTGYIFSLSRLFEDPQAISNQWRMLENFAALTFFESPIVSFIHSLVIGSAVGIGLPGLILLNRHLKNKPSAPSPIVGQQTGVPTGS